MFYLLQNQINTEVFRLQDFTTLASPYFWFQITNGFDKFSFGAYLENKTVNCPYQSFDFDLTKTTLQNGEYVLDVYESENIPVSIEDTTGKIVQRFRLVIGESIDETFNTTTL
jgi:hypothetical protein